MRTVLLFSLAAALLFGQTSQSSDKKRNSDPKQAETQNQPPAKNSPAPILAAPPTQVSAPNNATQSKQPAKATWGKYLGEAFSAPYLSNWVLAVFAAIAGIAAIATLTAIKEQARITRLGLTATRQAVHAARASAEAANASNALTADAIGLTRQEFILERRPKLTVRNLILDDGIRNDSSLAGRFRIVNIGETQAKVMNLFVTGKLYGLSLPMKPLYDGQTGDMIGQVLATGESIPSKFRRDDGLLDAGNVAALNNMESRGNVQRFYVFGFVTYEDMSQPPITRTTWFCRMFNRLEYRFVAVNNPDYEHED
jgi:hypothetical protein